MPETEATRRPPIILIANDYEWWGRSLETILTPRGYAVIRAFTGIQALHTARTSQLDAVILEARLPGVSGIALCRSLREEGIVGKSTPIIITSSGRMTHDEVVTALAAGAWAVCHYPLDGEMLALHLETFVAAKREADRARDESLIDSTTGFYSMRGLARRGREIAAEAMRGHSPLACVAVAPAVVGAEVETGDEKAAAPDTTPRAAAVLGQALLRCVRASDVVGHLGRGEFAIIARNTNSEGAERLTNRMRAALAAGGHETGLPTPDFAIRANYFAVADYAEAALDPVEMLERASVGLHSAAASPTSAAPANSPGPSSEPNQSPPPLS